MTETLGRIVMDAMRERDQFKAQGIAGEALDRAVETVIRDAWPKPKDRTTPWRDQCEICRDYGLEMLWCPGDATCGPNPVTKRPRPAHGPHEYGRACRCPSGDRHRDKEPPTPDDAAKRAAKPKKPMRWGR